MTAPAGSKTMATDGITVVVPVRDEAGDVASALASLAAQSVGPSRIEVLVYDGGSADRTVEICREFACRYEWGGFEVLKNPSRTVPYALNAALERSRCQWFTRLDGRIRFSPGYLERCMDAAVGDGATTAVGGRLETDAVGVVASAIAAAVSHPLGVGRGFRSLAPNRSTRLASIPHHPFAVWRTRQVRELGGFDLRLTRNQDDEFSMRAIQAGASIKAATDVTAYYKPRERFRGLAAQYFQYGLWKSIVARETRLFPLRSAVPALQTVCAAGTVALAASGRTRRPAAVLAGIYGAAGAVVGHRQPRVHAVPAGLALATVHICYGCGVIAGLVAPGLTKSPVARVRIR